MLERTSIQTISLNSIFQSIIKHATIYNNRIFILYRFTFFASKPIYIWKYPLSDTLFFFYFSFSHFRKDFWMISFFTSCVIYESVYYKTHIRTYSVFVVYTTWNMQEGILIVIKPDWIYTVIIFISMRLRLTFVVIRIEQTRAPMSCHAK